MSSEENDENDEEDKEEDDLMIVSRACDRRRSDEDCYQRLSVEEDSFRSGLDASAEP